VPDPEFGKITDAKLAQLKQRVGAGLVDEHWAPRPANAPRPPSAPHEQPHNTEVTVDALRHYAAGLADDNPLFFDPDYGRTTRWGGPIGHPLFVWTMGEDDVAEGMQRSEAYEALMKGDPIRGTGALQADMHYEFFRPLELGDRIYKRTTPLGYIDRVSSWGGRVVNDWRGVATRNHKGEVTHVQRGMWIRAERRPIKETKETQLAPEPYTPEQLREIDEAYARASRRGAEPLYWEDVNVGSELATRVKGPLRVTDIILWHVGWGMNFPTYAFDFAYRKRHETPGLYTPTPLNVPDIVQRMHWEEEWAFKVGAPARYDFGIIRENFLTQLITDWMGDHGWLWKLSVQHRKFWFVGDTAWVKGRVTGKRQTDAGNEVTLDVWCENQRGLLISPGNATVLLPSRERGPMQLPKPPRDNTRDLLAFEIERLASQEG